MNVTQHLKDCCTMALADGYTHVWVTMASSSHLDVGDVVALETVLTLEKTNYKHCFLGTMTALWEDQEMPHSTIKLSALLHKYELEARRYRQDLLNTSQAEFLARRKKEAESRVQHFRASVLAAFRATGLEPNIQDLLRAGWTTQEWSEIKQLPPPAGTA